MTSSCRLKAVSPTTGNWVDTLAPLALRPICASAPPIPDRRLAFVMPGLVVGGARGNRDAALTRSTHVLLFFIGGS